MLTAAHEQTLNRQYGSCRSCASLRDECTGQSTGTSVSLSPVPFDIALELTGYAIRNEKQVGKRRPGNTCPHQRVPLRSESSCFPILIQLLTLITKFSRCDPMVGLLRALRPSEDDADHLSHDLYRLFRHRPAHKHNALVSLDI